MFLLRNCLLSAMKHVENSDDTRIFLDAENNAVRLENELAKRVLEIFVFACDRAASRHRLKRGDLRVKSAQPVGGVLFRVLVNILEGVNGASASGVTITS